MKYMIMTFGDPSAWDTLGLGRREATWSEEQVQAHFQAMGEFYGEFQESGEMVTGFGLAARFAALVQDRVELRPVMDQGGQEI